MTAPRFNAPDICADIITALKSSEYWTDKTKENGKYINNVICPECGEARAFVYTESPFAIFCNRENNCGAVTKTIPLFDIVTRIEETYKPVKHDPHRPARKFLKLRGLPDDLIKKTTFKYYSKTRKDCGGGVFFPIAGKTWSGRLFNPPPNQGKTHTTGLLDGQFWQLDTKEYSKDKPLYITEGIINALSLFAMGHQAVALVAAATDPATFDLAKLQELGNGLILAFDGDAAGVKYTEKWTAYLKEKEVEAAAVLPIKGDWNDILCNAATPEKAAERFKLDTPRYETEARLALAETAQEYAEIYAEANKGYSPGLFPFKGCYYWSWIKRSKKEGDELLVSRASNFTVKVKHYQLSEQDKELPVFTYRLEVKSRKAARPITVTATGNDLKSPDALTGFFARHAKADWRGTAESARAFREMVMEADAPDIRQAEYTGYDHKSKFHVLKDIAVSPKGKVIKPEKGGYFKVGHGQYLHPFQTAPTIRPRMPEQNFIKDNLYPLLLKTWGEQAGVAVSFLLASLFVNQIKPELGFFPFLSMHGDPQTGKSRLMKSLNAMQGLDEEGLSMNSANTKKSELRAISQVSGMMKGMIEGNEQNKTRFDFESVLPLYNHGNPLQTRAAFSNDNRVISMMFHGTLAFAQNREPFTSRAAKERVISLKFSTDELSGDTKVGFDAVCAMPPQELAGFLPEILKHREFFENNWKEYHEKAKADLMQAVPDNRINENHAILLAFHRLFCEQLGINHDLLPYLEKIGSNKIISCRQRTLTPADFFFDALNEISDKTTDELGVTHENKSCFFEIKGKHLYINRTRAEKAIRQAGLTLDWPEKLGASLQEHPAFLQGGKNHRFQGEKDKPVKAMIFDISRMEDQPLQQA